MTNFPVDKSKKLFIKNDRNKLTRCAGTITKKNSHNTNFSTKLLFILASWLLLKYPVTERRERETNKGLVAEQSPPGEDALYLPGDAQTHFIGEHKSVRINFCHYTLC